MSVIIGGDFSLVDHDGAIVTNGTFLGRYLLIFFGFTHCRVVCSRALGRLSHSLELLGDLADEIQPLYVTVDPERDTPAVMRKYLSERHPRFTGLTGTSLQIDRMKAAFRVFARRLDDPDDLDGYSVPHTAFTFLLGRDGAYRTHFVDAGDAQELGDRIRKNIVVNQ